MNSEIIRNWSTFSKLEPEWNDLLFRSRASSIFLTWEWINAWRDAISDSASPYVIVVRNSSGKIMGLAPLYLASMRFLGVLPFRVLRFLADVATGLEYPDWIVDVDCEPAVVNTITETLDLDSHNWDALWLPNIAGWTGAKERILNPNAVRQFWHRSRPRDFSCIKLPATIEEYEATLSPKKRYELRRNERRFQGLGEVTFCVCEDQTELPEFLNALFELHHQRWQMQGDEGIFVRRPAEKRFYSNFGPVALKNDWLALFGLRYRERLKAVQIGYRFNRIFYSLQAGFDPYFETGVGHYLRHRVIKHLIDHHFEAIDHLGTYTEHKRRWGAQVRSGHEIFMAAPKLRTLPLFFHAFWPRGRYIELHGPETN